MPDVNKNVESLNNLIAEIKNHPMCLKFSSDNSCYEVIYPPGDFSVDGVRASVGAGKLVALQRILNRMELDWVNSYPNKITN